MFWISIIFGGFRTNVVEQFKENQNKQKLCKRFTLHYVSSCLVRIGNQKRSFDWSKRFMSSCTRHSQGSRPGNSQLSFCSLSLHRPQRWSIFQGDGMVNVFFRPPLPSMVFQWFWQSWTITIECFLGGPTIGTNGFSMVFKILRAMVYNGFEVSDGLVAFLWISCSSSLIGGTNDCLTCADGIGVAGRYLPDCLTAHCTLLKESLILKWTLFNLFSGLKMSWMPWQMGLKLGLSASVLAPPNIDNWKTMDVKCNVINRRAI